MFVDVDEGTEAPGERHGIELRGGCDVGGIVPVAKNARRTSMPRVPDCSGRNWQAIVGPRQIAAANGTP